MNSMMAALYVGDLHSDVTEPMLVEKFSPAGPIHSIRLCRDRKTGSSLGYAYINFQHRVDAERALEELNFELLMGQPMRIMWSQRDSSLRKTGIGNLFIKNLDKSIDSMALFDTFSIFGKVLSCKVVRYEKGSKGYGYVHYKSAEAADLAMERLNGKLLNGCKVLIEHFKSREERKVEKGPRPQVLTNIYIKNFGDEMNNKELKDIFSKFGPVVSVRVMTDENGKSRRFGFVRFERHEDAQRAVDEMNGKELNGNKVYVGQAQNKVERQAELKHKYEQGLNLYVKNLDGSVDDEHLRTEFSPFGTIINAKVMMENGRSKGFGFVRFSSPEEAMNAIKWMNGRMWGRKALYVGVAQRKEERRAYLAHQNIQTMASMQTQNLAPNYASSQLVQMTFPHCTMQTIQPQYVHHMPSVVQNMPEVIQFATTHQQTYGIFTLTTSQVPCLDEVCTNTTTPTAADSIPVADTVPAVDTVPALDTVIAVDTVPAVDTVIAVDTVPAVDTVIAVDTVPAVDTVIAVDTVPALDTVIAVDTVPAVDTVTAVDTMPAVDMVIPVDTIPAVDTVIPVDTMPAVDTVIPVDTMPAVDSVTPVDTVPAVDTVIPVDTVPAVDTVIAVDTVPAVDTVTAVDTMPAVDMVIPVDTMPAVDTVIPVDTMPAVDSVTPVDTVPAVDTVIPVDTVPAVDTVIAVDTVPAVDTVIAVDTVPAVDTVTAVATVPTVNTVIAVDTVPAVDTAIAVDAVQTVDTVANANTVPAVDTVPGLVPAAGTGPAPADDAAPEPAAAEVPASAADEDTTSSTSTASCSQDVPIYPPAGKVLTIYMLESAPVDDQIQMAHDYMLPLVEKIHPTLANKITWMLLEGENNYEIMNMIGDPELLRGRVDEMDALLKAREAGHKPETLKMFYNNNSKKKKKRKKK